MIKIAIYGKGGIGKSTIASNLSSILGLKKKVIHIGCDPKRDSTRNLLGNKEILSFLDVQLFGKGENFIVRGTNGVDCIECGGPKPGLGCAGRGVSSLMNYLEENLILSSYDAAIFDVLGDVVCGGFAAPLRKGFAEKVVIVVSEEIMSLYAANNIMNAINTYSSNGVFLAGILVNLRYGQKMPERVLNFSKKTNSNILGVLYRSNRISSCESSKETLIEKYPDSDEIKILYDISDKIIKMDKEDARIPNVLTDQEFDGIFKGEDHR